MRNILAPFFQPIPKPGLMRLFWMTLPLTAAILLLFIHPARLDTSDFTLIAWDPGRELLKTGTVYANYPYPLWTVVVLLPFVFLPLKWAMVCWTIANLLMLAAALAVLISLFDWEFSSGLFILLIVLFVSFLPVLTSMWLGQLTIFSLLLLVLTVYSFLYQRWTWLGIILGLSFIKPQVMVLLAGFILLWALFQRRWKVLLGFGGVIVVLVLISLPFISRPGQIIGGGIASHLSTYIQKTSTLWGFLLSLGMPWWVPALISIFLLVWLLILWWPALHEKDLQSERVLFLFSLTTLINLITGMLKPDRGRILLAGEEITALPPAQRVRRGLVRTFQINTLFPHLNALEAVTLAGAEVILVTNNPEQYPFLPCRKVAEHGVKPPAAHQWNDNASRTKYNERIAVGIDIDRRCHSISLRSASVHVFVLH